MTLNSNILNNFKSLRALPLKPINSNLLTFSIDSIGKFNLFNNNKRFISNSKFLAKNFNNNYYSKSSVLFKARSVLNNDKNIINITNTKYVTTHRQLQSESSPLSTTVDTLTAQQSRDVIAQRSYFDTHAFVMSLIQQGFTQKQAEELCTLFKDIVNFIARDIKKECVTKTGQDLAIQQVMIHIGSLKKDMIILEKSEFSALRSENEKLTMELKSLREQLSDEVIKLKGGFTLDINLEKNRSTETIYEVTNRVHKLDSRIDTEISNVKALLEAFKAEVIRYIAGSMFTALVILLGALRYFAS